MILRGLKGRGSFGDVLHTGKRFSSGPLIVFYRASKETATQPEIRVGVGVSKRNCPKSVVRNRVKRLLRQSVYRYFGEHKEMIISADVVLLWNAKLEHVHEIKLSDVLPLVESTLLRVFK